MNERQKITVEYSGPCPHCGGKLTMTPGWSPTERLRLAFIRWLTVDSEHSDRRRRDYNQAIFDGADGHAVWTSTDLDMVLQKFDRAVTEVQS